MLFAFPFSSLVLACFSPTMQHLLRRRPAREVGIGLAGEPIQSNRQSQVVLRGKRGHIEFGAPAGQRRRR